MSAILKKCKRDFAHFLYFIFGLLLFQHPILAEDIKSPLSILNPNQNKTQVMIFGTFHFKARSQTSFDPQIDVDIKSPEKQKEIHGLVTLLSQYKPTKIAVEIKANRQKSLDSLYHEYIFGSYDLEPSEVYQIGFRLARNFNHEKVYAVDAKGFSCFANTTEKEYNAKVRKLDHPDLNIQLWKDRYAQLFDYENSLKSSLSLQEYLFYLNTEERILKGNGYYLINDFKLNSGEDYFGPDLGTVWYNRNLRIFSNLQRISKPADRILLIIGAGHVAIIRHAVQCSPELELIEVNHFLEKHKN